MRIMSNVNQGGFQTLFKDGSERDGWVRTTKAMEIEDVGCIVQLTTQKNDNFSEALSYIPGVRIETSKNGDKKLVKI